MAKVKKRKGFTWIRKKAWAVCGHRGVVSDNQIGYLVFGSRALADGAAYTGEGETVRPCEVIVKVKEEK